MASLISRSRAPAMVVVLGLLSVAATGVWAGEAHPNFVNIGYGVAHFRTTGKASAMGMPVDGARVALDSLGYVAIEIGRRMSPDWSISFLGGLPPTVSLQGRGAFAPQGMLRRVKYGSVMLGAQFHPVELGRLEPYVGAGANYTVIFKTHSGSMTKLDVGNAFGPYVQAGARVRVAERLSVYLDIRKSWQAFDSEGIAAGGIPVSVRINPDPISSTFGLSYRF